MIVCLDPPIEIFLYSHYLNLRNFPGEHIPKIPLVSCAFGTYRRGYCTTITHILSYASPRKKIPDAAPGEESNYLMIYAFLSEKSIKCQVLSSLCLKNKKIIRNKFIGVNTICVFVN